MDGAILSKSMRRAKKRKINYLRTSITASRINTLLKEQNGRCCYCNHSIFLNTTKNPKYLATVEHKQPISKGGNNSKKNIALACYECNQSKGDLTEEEFINLINNAERITL